jgi:adenylosuccinate lyase
VPLAHLVIALNSLLKGIGKLELNKSAIDADLEDSWTVVAEGIQSILRRENYPQPYEELKSLTRTNEKITQVIMNDFIDSLEVNDDIKVELKAITPFNYTGK